MSLPPQNPYAAVQPMNPSDERLWATLIHLGGIILYFLAPLIGLLVLGPRGPFIRAHAVEALNFQISLLIYSIGLIFVTILTLGIGGLLYIPLGILALVFMIMAAVAANKGEFYKYPLTITFVR
jgi:uncharacterized Tic20 family protein